MSNYKTEQNDNVWFKIEKKNKIKINHPDIFDENLNKKKILCNNYLKGEVCHYGDKCLYAHSIGEQKMDIVRKKAYDIIQNEFDLSYLDFGKKNDDETNELLKNLIVLTKVCQECLQKKCAGGINCKFGVYMNSLQVCYDDLHNGKCYNKDCKKVHLTKRGFIPINKYNDTKKKKKYNGLYIPKAIELNDDFFLSDSFKNIFNDSDIIFDDSMSSDNSLEESIFS